MFSIFSKKNQTEILSPVNGKMIPLESVEDRVFSSKMMGEGVAFELQDGVIVSPVNGVIEMIPSSLHAVGITGTNGLEILIHVGLDTVDLGGDGFTSLVKQGDKVKKGTPILKVDIEYLKDKVILTTPMIVTNSSEFDIFINDLGRVEREKTIVMKCKKR